jgi:O-antigen/teichoic acid export membrane protein
MIVALTKLGSSLMVGQFSLGLAITTPILMFANLHLRTVQATDAKRLFSFSDYLHLRMATTLSALVLITIVVWFAHYKRETALVVLATALAKGIETLSDLHYGLFQFSGHLDETGKSLMLRGVLSLIALSAALWATREVFWGCIAVSVVWLTSLFLFDVPRGRRLITNLDKLRLPDTRDAPQPPGAHPFQRWHSLVRLALPLGVVTTLVSINLNMPRYFIHARMGERQLGIFSAMAYSTVAMTIVGDSLGSCAIPRMSRLYASGRLSDFRSLLLKLVALACTLGVAGLVIVKVIGARLLTVFYNAEYADYSHVFLLLVLATAIQGIAVMLTTGITSARRFGVQVPLLCLVAGSSALACSIWVPAAGLSGGAMAMIIAACVHLVLAAAVVRYLLLRAGREAIPLAP